jgi:hypothetical protein
MSENTFPLPPRFVETQRDALRHGVITVNFYGLKIVFALIFYEKRRIFAPIFYENKEYGLF